LRPTSIRKSISAGDALFTADAIHGAIVWTPEQSF
jgi:hypothetical protein